MSGQSDETLVIWNQGSDYITTKDQTLCPLVSFDINVLSGDATKIHLDEANGALKVEISS